MYCTVLHGVSNEGIPGNATLIQWVSTFLRMISGQNKEAPGLRFALPAFVRNVFPRSKLKFLVGYVPPVAGAKALHPRYRRLYIKESRFQGFLYLALALSTRRSYAISVSTSPVSPFRRGRPVYSATQLWTWAQTGPQPGYHGTHLDNNPQRPWLGSEIFHHTAPLKELMSKRFELTKKNMAVANKL
ncbi:hypothetical protein B0H16DRAFT_1474724 [Mycena metata]|uniref:Uncharacterized protein n=1 Tax=Mycena metata TaxID=1033252 RepID=A0AAD7HGC2_9AGAR|nr:hypothetical protein B0H16DRAFT_1474724 [Mycena metata]